MDFGISLQGAGFGCCASENAMSFGIYAAGTLVLIVGVAYLAHLMHVPQSYIVAMAIILFGIGIVTGVQKTRSKDPS
jgi:lipoprotein signal peptidase